MAPPTNDVRVFGRVEPSVHFRGRSSLNVRTCGRVAPYVILPVNVAPEGFLTRRSDQVPGASFSGVPKVYDVVFTTPYPTNNYSISIDGSDGRAWTAENVLATGFRINAQAGAAFSGMVRWSTSYRGEAG